MGRLFIGVEISQLLLRELDHLRGCEVCSRTPPQALLGPEPSPKCEGIKGQGIAPMPQGGVILFTALPHPTSMSFRVNAKNFFITYPKCHISPKDISEHIANVREYNSILAVRELHEDGTPHLHVLVQFASKFNCTRQDAFDYEDAVEKFHPNIQSARNVADVKKYLLKSAPEGDNIHEEGEISAKRLWSEIVNASTSEEVHNIARELSPRDYVLSYDRICQFAQTKRFRREEYVPKYNTFAPPEDCEQWVRLHLPV